MSERLLKRLIGLALALDLVAAVSLLAPWAASGRVDRSMFGVVSSASALDLLSGFNKFVVVSALVFVVVAVAIGVIGAAWSHTGVVVYSLLGVGPVLAVASLVVERSPLALRWGAILSPSAGMAASICASIVGLAQFRRRKQPT